MKAKIKTSRIFTVQTLAFTLVELLVVIAVLGILAGLLLPALVKAKARANVAICLNHKRQLGLAWLLYAEDANAELTRNDNVIGPPPPPGYYPTMRLNWTKTQMDWNTTEDIRQVEWLMDPRCSSLAPYIRKREVYKCPEDRFLSPAQRKAGWIYADRLRSVSMNAYMGWGSKKDLGASRYRVYERLDQLVRLSPSRALVFLDEHPNGIAGAPFFPLLIRDTGLSWVQLPASYHSGAGGLSFADGHSEIKKWVSADTRQPVFDQWDLWWSNLRRDNFDTRDLFWLFDRCTELK